VSTVGRVVFLAVAAGAALLSASLFSPVPVGRAVDGYLLFLGALVAFALVQATREASPAAAESAYERALRARHRRAARPPELEKLEREVVLAAMSSFDLHMRMRPLLREIAGHRLATRRGLELDRGGPGVQETLGEDLWELLRPGREPPHDRFAPGLPLAELRGLLDQVENI
jgi:hypothetical protein